uniref:Uncharacterized protein n=1 Tax=Oryza nivara TaxID=4536 RepID=A0A0E0HKG8_ORYNI
MLASPITTRSLVPRLLLLGFRAISISPESRAAVRRSSEAEAERAPPVTLALPVAAPSCAGLGSSPAVARRCAARR